MNKKSDVKIDKKIIELENRIAELKRFKAEGVHRALPSHKKGIPISFNWRVALGFVIGVLVGMYLTV
ncbi:hypothetical protein [Shewanella sp. UCD-KL12]|uniref:hypothetical protein n=1 Tax=Shewanella sp. UCD-KL12 TaxID=1917163 RepID=UPI000970FA25|nr:hypothetical protein [Shewanella sp. UCD-KL12]